MSDKGEMMSIKIGRVIHGSGSITREYKSLKPKREMCRGCYNDFYNGRQNMNCFGCFSFDNAKVVDKVGYGSLRSTSPDTKLVKTLSCWHAVSK